jgi:hypothetical protein
MLSSDYLSAAFLLDGYNYWRVRHDANTLGRTRTCCATPAATRAIQGWLGHRSITSTAVYAALAPNRFKDFWRE